MRTTPGLDDAFDRAAGRYDLLTRLNPGYHRHLRAAAHALAERIGGGPGRLVLDLGCGSGASTAALVGAIDDARVVAVDASSGMLEQAAAKSWPAGVEFVHATAEALPELGLPPAAGAFAAYLIRNIPEDGRDDVLRIIRDRLAPGGWLVVQEYSVAGRPSAVRVWTLVCRFVVVPLARLVHGSPRLYDYLWRSVLDFDSTAELADRLVGAGYTDVAHRDATGWQRGILHTWVARRPG
ncbi:MAG: class I SAM-dependent methyltransferase [Propionicimonas sp.]|uniref:class I SAM-dependent methyltransferase n=1 Tax=Propionicimonas sp. TaxID=1955623 RepID=UPI003D0C4646